MKCSDFCCMKGYLENTSAHSAEQGKLILLLFLSFFVASTKSLQDFDVVGVSTGEISVSMFYSNFAKLSLSEGC